MAVRREDTLELAWAAGLIDGEGCIFIARQIRQDRPGDGFSLRLAVSMVHLPTLQRLQEVLGGNAPTQRTLSPSSSSRARAAWHWSLTGQAAYAVLMVLLPYFFTKRPEALCAIQFYETRPFTRFPKGGRTKDVEQVLEQYRLELKALKRYEWPHRLPGADRDDGDATPPGPGPVGGYGVS